MHLLPGRVTDAVAMGVEANWCIERRFTPGPANTDVPARGAVGVDSPYDFAFIVPVAFTDADVSARHAPAFSGSDCGAGGVDVDLRVHVFEVDAWGVGGVFAVAVGDCGEHSGGFAGDIAEATTVHGAGDVSN